MLKEHRKESIEKGRGIIMLCDTGGHVRSLEQDLRVLEGGYVCAR